MLSRRDAEEAVRPNIRALFVGGAAVIVITLLLLIPVWQSGAPWGSDSWGHLHRAAFLNRELRSGGSGAWMPDWYLGDPAWVYYPPLAGWVLGALTLPKGDPFLAYRLFVTGVLLALGLSVYAVGVLWGGAPWSGAVAGVLAVTAPYTLRTIFVEGNLPRGLAVALLPWIFWLTERLLIRKDAHIPFGALSVLWALAIMAHVMQAVMFAFAVAFYVGIRALSNVYVPLRRVLLALIPVGMGAALSAAYLLPAYGHLELANVPYLPASKIPLFSIQPEALLPLGNDIEAVSVGLGAIILAAVITLRTEHRTRLALLLTGIACVILAFGPAGGLYRLLPLSQSLLPERFLNISAVILPLIVATVPHKRKRRYLMTLIAFIVIALDFGPASRVIHMRPAPPEEQAIAEQLAARDLPGRVAPLTLPNPTASGIFLAGEIGGRESVSGWALENTPHQDAVRRLLSAAKRAPDYVSRVLSLWNVDYVIVRPGEDAGEAEPLLGFGKVGRAGSLVLWERESPSAFAQILPEGRMLVIGRNATDWLAAFPYASEAASPDPAAYDRAYLDRFRAIGLNRVPDRADIEGALGSWVEAGGTLLVDLSGMGAIYDQGYTLFDVQAVPMAIEGTYAVTWLPMLEGLPDTLNFSTPEGAWIGAAYRGLDGKIASISLEGKSFPLIGYRDVGEGRVWFVGFNLFYRLREEREIVRALADFLTPASTQTALELPALPIEALKRTPDRVRFRYDIEEPASAVLSMTAFPRWRAEIDGVPVPIQDHEHLMLIELPAGAHTVTLTYHPLGGAALLGWAASGAGLLIMAGAMYALKRRPPLATADRIGHFSDRLP
jgi:hypothetical protein